MKKLSLLAALAFAVQLSYAATPLEQAGQVNQGPYSNTQINISTNPASGTSALFVIPVTSKNSGGQTINCRNCITHVFAELTTGTTLYVLDGGTTDYTIYGGNLLQYSGQTIVTWNKAWQPLEPFCGTSGNTMTFSMPAPATATSINVVNAEGYTFCGYANNNGL